MEGDTIDLQGPVAPLLGQGECQSCVRQESRNGNINNQRGIFSLTQSLYNALHLAYLLESYLLRWQMLFKKCEGRVNLLCMNCARVELLLFC